MPGRTWRHRGRGDSRSLEILEAGHPILALAASVRAMELVEELWHPLWSADVPFLPAERMARSTVHAGDDEAVISSLFRQHGASLVRLARLFVDDRNAAEDLVQEAFIRLSRSLHRIEDPAKETAYLRSIVLNLCRDHNRRGLVSLRHHLPFDERVASSEDTVVVGDDHRRAIDAVRALPIRQRDCVVLRYFFEAGPPEIAATLGISENSVKTHLKRALTRLRDELGDLR